MTTSAPHPRRPAPNHLQLTKHHGLGNDFLVALLGEGAVPNGGPNPGAGTAPATVLARGPALARWLCDRRRGVGADGLILAPVAPDPESAAAMVLFNADGSRAEMSGNGVRCLGQALALAGLTHESPGGDVGSAVVVSTDAGPRHLLVSPGAPDQTSTILVGMGPVGPGPRWQPSERARQLLGELQPSAAGLRAVTASVGNPHLVIEVADPWAVDLAKAGPLFEADFPDGINVEFIAPRGGAPSASAALDLTVWERGAGITEACGTGATAAATVAHRWGLVGPAISVYMPGGMVEVIVEEQQSRLSGPSTFVARIEVDLA